MALPFIGLWITKHYSDKNLKMPPHYVVERVVHEAKDGKGTTDTIYHRVEPFALENQLKDTISLKDLEGTVVLVNFFQTDDSSISVPVSRVLAKMQRSFARSDTGLHLLSISTNPSHDQVPELRKFADMRQANHDVWWFVRGPLDKIKGMAEKDFNLSLKPHGANGSLASPTLILLDRIQHVRGYYNGLDSTDVKRCVRDVSLLMIENEKQESHER